VRKSIHSAPYKRLVALMRTRREELGISQEVVAGRLGITPSQLSKWERRERRIDVDEARRYCRAIGLELVDLIAQWERELPAESTPVEVPRNPTT
jgi:transcriptional regulator with XRE-family HTH domain